MMLCSILYQVVILLNFLSFERFPIPVLVKVVLQILKMHILDDTPLTYRCNYFDFHAMLPNQSQL